MTGRPVDPVLGRRPKPHRRSQPAADAILEALRRAPELVGPDPYRQVGATGQAWDCCCPCCASIRYDRRSLRITEHGDPLDGPDLPVSLRCENGCPEQGILEVLFAEFVRVVDDFYDHATEAEVFSRYVELFIEDALATRAEAERA